ncbi:MAG: sugar transferase [Patescibacteria group bacterium]|nr:sugar transferase [Patescibacteria group bacterium]
MKKPELFFSFLLVPLDYALLLLAAVSAYHLRFSDISTDIRPVIFNLPFDSYFELALIIAVAWVIIFALAGMYSIRQPINVARELSRIILACSTGLALIAIYIFFQRELFDSRFIVIAAWLLSIVYISFGRLFIRFLRRRLYRFGIGSKRIVLVGNSKTTDKLLSEFAINPYLGFKVVKRLRDFSLDSAQELLEIMKTSAVDDIMQSDPNLTKAESLRLYDFASEYHLTYKYVADLLEVKVLRTEVTSMLGIPIVEVKKTTLDGWGRIWKRLLDIIGSSLLILIFSPILLLVALAVKLDSRGPIFFSNRDDGSVVTRVGEGGKPFRYFKFRSMVVNSDNMRYRELADNNLRTDGPLVKIKDDPRVTNVGKVIRRWSLDELPELFLVFMGKMSLVGPRPHLPEEVAKYEHHHRKTLTVKPGITGLAQVSGRSDLLFEEEVKLDVYYLENWSLFLDVSILLKTPLAVLKHREAE